MKFSYNSSDGILVMDMRGKIKSVNKAAEKILGVSSEKVRGKYCYEVVDGWDLCGNRFCFEGCSVMKMIQNNEPVQGLYVKIKRPKGKDTWLCMTTLVEPEKENSDGRNIVHILRPVPQGVGITCLPEGLISALNEGILKSNKAVKKAGSKGIPSLPAGVSLTSREKEILGYMTDGKVAKDISQTLGISLATARSHIQNIIRKLGVHSKLEAVALVLKRNRG